jgi:hypothetical protein
MVGAEHAERGVARLHAALELLHAPLVDGAECLDRAHLVPRFILATTPSARASSLRSQTGRRVAEF